MSIVNILLVSEAVVDQSPLWGCIPDWAIRVIIQATGVDCYFPKLFPEPAIIGPASRFAQA